MTNECNCGAVDDGKWAGVHSKYCALQLQNYKYRMHDMERNVIVRVNGMGHGEEICNTLNSVGDQDLNAQFILEAIKAFKP